MRRDQRAFVAARDDEGAEDSAGLGELIDVPAPRLAAPHVTAEPGAKSARALGRAAIEIASRREQGRASAGVNERRRVERDQQGVSAGRGGGFGGSGDKLHRTMVDAKNLPVAAETETGRGCGHRENHCRKESPGLDGRGRAEGCAKVTASSRDALSPARRDEAEPLAFSARRCPLGAFFMPRLDM